MLKLKYHSVIILTGPSGCGKTFFCKNVLIPALQKHVANVQYISSDAIRRELLNDNEFSYDKHSFEMTNVSAQAFDLLYKKLELVTSYPVNAPFVIVDTTGLSSEFRTKVSNIAKASNYNTCCIVFCYKDREEYFKYVEAPNKVVTSAHISRLHRVAMPQIRKKDFTTYLQIKQKDFSDIPIEIVDLDEYNSHTLDPAFRYPIIGDVHGCYEELKQILATWDFIIQDDKIIQKPTDTIPILIGDYIDGIIDGVEKTIDFLYKNKEHFKFVLGNHEHFVYLALTGQLDQKSLPAPSFIQEHFPSLALLKDNAELADKFKTLVEASKVFYKGRNFVVTHAPCEEHHLEKLHPYAFKNQKNFRYPHREENESLADFSHRFEEALFFLKDAATENKPYHIFGHCRMQNVARIKNKIGIDTGCNHGNRLTAVLIDDRNQAHFIAVSSSHLKNEELPEVFTKRNAYTTVLKDVDFADLDPKEVRRIKTTAKNKVNYISGTMSPADKDMNLVKLETIGKALEYYRNLNVDKVCLQPKYMGSRVEVMLNYKDLSKSYTSTRRGYIVKHIDLTSAYEQMRASVNLPNNLDVDNIEWYYLDCELMPWFALGKGLIESQYLPVQHALESEIRLLKETGFEEKLADFIKEFQESNYLQERNQLSKQEIYKKISHHKCSGYEAIQKFTWIPLDEQQKYFEIYKEQLDLFGQAGDYQFKPFSILKIIPSEGTEIFPQLTNSEQFNLVSEDECLVIDLASENAESEAEGFFNMIVEKNLEGVVVKPEIPYIKGVAPFLKVRNPRYLSIIYGYDYLHPIKYQKLVNQKRIRNKLQTSMTEYEYGKRMLEIPYSDISIKNKEYVSLITKLIFEEKKEERFDPRL